MIDWSATDARVTLEALLRYLEGTLPEDERSQLIERLRTDEEVQRRAALVLLQLVTLEGATLHERAGPPHDGRGRRERAAALAL